jgi:acid phosphatase
MLVVASGFLWWIPVEAQQSLPRPDHVVIVVEENHGFKQIIGSPSTPYINSLAQQGSLLTSFFALHHPSQPNYHVLFSGDRQGIFDNNCAQDQPLIKAPSLGGQLITSGQAFIGYAEDLPQIGSLLCKSGKYARRHAPWVNFADVPTLRSVPFSQFPTTFEQLPTLAIVIPNLIHDMHDLSCCETRRKRGDDWLKDRLGAYAEWSKTHNSLLIVTWDEDDKRSPKVTKPRANRIAAIFVGQMVKPGFQSDKEYTHVDLLRTLQQMFGLPPLEKTKNARIIDDIWQ